MFRVRNLVNTTTTTIDRYISTQETCPLGSHLSLSCPKSACASDHGPREGMSTRRKLRSSSATANSLPPRHLLPKPGCDPLTRLLSSEDNLLLFHVLPALFSEPKALGRLLCVNWSLRSFLTTDSGQELIWRVLSESLRTVRTLGCSSRA